MADHQIQQVDLPQRIPVAPVGCAGRHPMTDPRSQFLDHSRISPVIVAVDPGYCLLPQRHFEQFSDVFAYGLGVGPAMASFQLLAPLSLGLFHSSAASDLAVGEVEEEVGIFFDGQVVVEGVVLGQLEGHETVDDDVLGWSGLSHHVGMEEHAVSAEPRQVTVDGLGGDAEVACDLAVGHAASCLGEESGVEIGSFLPV